MFRSVVILTAMAAAAGPAAEPKTEPLKFGTPYTGEISGEKVKVPGTQIMRYRAAIPISLKAGQEISATVTVPGKERIVGMLLFDPMRKPLTRYDPGEKSAKMPSTEVSAKAVYTLVVYSDAVGPFTLTVTSRNPGDEEEKALVEKINRLRKELDEAEARLKAIRDKK